MEDVLEHRLFKVDGNLRYFKPGSETMDIFVRQQAKALTASIDAGDSRAVEDIFGYGGVHLNMIDDSIGGSTVTPLMRAAFVGEATTVEVLLDEVEESWPQQIRKECLDRRTSLGLTAHMIACARGHHKISEQIKEKGCGTHLVNSFGQTGNDLLQATNEDHEDHEGNLSSSHQVYESLEEYLALLDRKAIVMSCPENGTLDPNGGPPYDQRVMDKINELRQRGRLKGGFDRAGSSNSDPRDDKTWPKIFKTKKKEHLFEANEEKRKELIKSTYWFTGYRTAAKAQMNLECQTFDGTLVIICIKGGPITDVEHEEMDQIIRDAKHDAAVNGIHITIQLKKVSYLEFLEEYDSGSLSSEKQTHELAQTKLEPKAASSTADGDAANLQKEAGEVGNARLDVHAQLAEARAQLAAAQAKDEELASVVAAKDELASVVAAKDEELKQLRAQLERLEGVPPQRPDKDVQ